MSNLINRELKQTVNNKTEYVAQVTQLLRDKTYLDRFHADGVTKAADKIQMTHIDQVFNMKTINTYMEYDLLTREKRFFTIEDVNLIIEKMESKGDLEASPQQI